MSSRGAHARETALALLTSESGLLGLCVRFVLAGGVSTIVYLLITTIAAIVVGLPFQAALALGFCASFCLGFMVQRRFVWVRRERYVLPIHRQAGRFLLMACFQYSTTALATALLPPVLGVPTEIVYLAMVALLSVVNFMVLRHRIFHAVPAAGESAGPVEPGGLADTAQMVSDNRNVSYYLS
ncbi:MAG TPA: GtrA family protein [Solirubrobacteraceae bacterium]|nr:GtrA family protein [Solirubrobacteraceae bacterium]